MLHPFRKRSRRASSTQIASYSTLWMGMKKRNAENSDNKNRNTTNCTVASTSTIPDQQQHVERATPIILAGLTPFLAVPGDAGSQSDSVSPLRKCSSIFTPLFTAFPLGLGGGGRHGSGEERLKRGLSESVYAVSGALAPLLWLMRLLGLFPCPLRVSRRRQNGRFVRFLKRICFLLISIGAICLNLYLLRHNIHILLRFRQKFGLMHASSVSTIVTGIKPLINAVNLSLFTIGVRAHLRMLRLMDSLDRSYWTTFQCAPKIRSRLLPAMFGSMLISFVIPFAYRVFECLKLHGQRDTKDWLPDLSLAIVPLLTVWNVLPLCYYVLCNRLVCFWCRALMDALHREHQRRRYSLKFYYQQFLRLTDLQEAIGDLFNPCVLFSLAWALLMLSMTIYFITQPTSRLAEPITDAQLRSEVLRRVLNERIWLNLGWSLLQICVALAHICVICAIGTATNEQSRYILQAVLSVIPDSNAELDRFQISCFVHKMSTQYLWGMTVWRAFPLERSTFFTLTSVIITYSFLLLKLKDNTGTVVQPPIAAPLIINNDTISTNLTQIVL